jgi:hypothetical protein
MVHYLIFAPGAGCVGRPPASSNAVVVTPHGFLSPRRHSDGNGKSGFEAPRNSLDLDLDADNPNDIQVNWPVVCLRASYMHHTRTAFACWVTKSSNCLRINSLLN